MLEKQPFDKQAGEREFLKRYRQSDYERPSLAVDMTVFTMITKKAEDYRKLPEKEFSILLIKRGEYPYLGYWALPGGFVRKGETLEDTAYRELHEEAGVTDIYLSQLQSFSDPNRDPRGWIISSVFTALAEENLFQLKAGEDAVDAKWFRITYDHINTITEDDNGVRVHKRLYQLSLTCDEIRLSADIEVRYHITNKKKGVQYIVLESKGIAFDHGKMIGYAIQHLRDNLNTSMLGFELLPEYFTLTDLQRVYELILGEKLLSANFRRKIADFVEETDLMQEGKGHRPSKLFQRKQDRINS